MFSISTAWLHETSDKPLEVFDNHMKGWTGLKWTPANGKSYTVVFVDFPDIVEERLGMPSREILVSIMSPAKVYSAFIAPEGEHSDASLRKKFGVQGHLLTGLSAVIHMAVPLLDKKVGMQKWKKLTGNVEKALH